ncbi:hypothetical protein ACIBG7_27330 [Nonomuraea sp. NPDC050328]|uniref:hypothetical protein n=1 Tax=Nonomuraea sp. NPDC050328 TaxID=3364361 RepID=UPI00378E2164
MRSTAATISPTPVIRSAHDHHKLHSPPIDAAVTTSHRLAQARQSSGLDEEAGVQTSYLQQDLQLREVGSGLVGDIGGNGFGHDGLTRGRAGTVKKLGAGCGWPNVARGEPS